MKTTRGCFYRIAIRVGTIVLFALGSWARAATDDASDAKLVVILTRHGVRSPLTTQSRLDKFAAQPWPIWKVPPGHLTPHGQQQMVVMGDYYRARYTAEHLLTGDPVADEARIFFRADSDQRTIETARHLGTALLPQVKIDVHTRVAGVPDPLFRPVIVPVGHPDRQLGMAAVLGRLGGDPSVIQQAYRPAFETLERILVGESGEIPAGKQSVLTLPASVAPGERDHTVDVRGPLQTAQSITDVLLLEYAEGLPLSEVGWGRVTPERLTEILELHSLFFELAQGSFYPSQVQGSNLASHLLATLNQAATGRVDPAAFGAPQQKMVMIVGHDTNIINLGALLGLTWWLPGTHRNPVLPGGALVFELRERQRDHQLVVRAYYVSQTLEQMRTLAPLSLEHPPGIAPIFIPGCSESSAGFDAPLPAFEALVRRVVDRQFVVESAE
jgi:4-phytase / acid phosphatase